MAQRIREDEAQRWKRKFLDAIEDHEAREKALTARVKLLRRGLLGVSLAGEGHDPRLDKQLSELRATLRHADREAGLDLLLEQIEQTIIRLDTEKNTSNWALEQAFESAISELNKLPLSASMRRQLKKFSGDLQTRLEDPQQHTGLIKQFIDLLGGSVQTLLENEKHNEDVTPTSRKGFWQRFFSTSAENDPVDARSETKSDTSPPEVMASAKAEITTAGSTAVLREASVPRPPESPPPFPCQSEAQFPPDVSERLSAEPDGRADVDGDIADAAVIEQEQTQESDQDLNLQQPDEQPEVIEGELIRDRSGLVEPAFSYIAGHVEPLLLRILESVHITGESVSLVESIRRCIIKGLHWYDFAAILEQILQVLRHAADGQRAEFLGFLSEVTENLALVQAFLDHSKHSSDKSAAAEAAMDATVRAQIQDIKTAVESADTDIESLKSVVQNQIGSIISSLDGLKAQRTEQDHSLPAEMQALTERIASLENESSELRLNIARQQDNATRDTLTELPNREAYNLRMRQLLDAWLQGASDKRRDDDRSLCLAVADVDSFKNINDSYGHLAGDKVIKIIARAMLSRLREKDFIGRYGGEEFVIIMPDTRPADAEQVLNNLRLAVAAIPFHFKERQIQITISFGVVEAMREDNPETLFERADRALCKAKENGRNRVHRDR